jgi:nitroreductase
LPATVFSPDSRNDPKGSPAINDIEEFHMANLGLSADALLSTTRAVRKRLDFDRPVERELLRECLELAMQAPTGSNAQGWQFMIVDDVAQIQGIAELYKKAWSLYPDMPFSAHNVHKDDPSMKKVQDRVVSSAEYLGQNMDRVPAMLIPLVEGRFDGTPSWVGASIFGSILPATWNFMLAARERGLGTCWTTLHLMHEKEEAQALGIPYDDVTQVALIPIAHTKGTDFRPGPRKGLDGFVHWNRW